mmetsp:Transcript_32406/g.102964  ORF Transcript_32406/g.102964 Transcript_32406/m.102964 type:complete len:235 (-) Transcript_32406:282-986(-)
MRRVIEVVDEPPQLPAGALRALLLQALERRLELLELAGARLEEPDELHARRHDLAKVHAHEDGLGVELAAQRREVVVRDLEPLAHRLRLLEHALLDVVADLRHLPVVGAQQRVVPVALLLLLLLDALEPLRRLHLERLVVQRRHRAHLRLVLGPRQRRVWQRLRPRRPRGAMVIVRRAVDAAHRQAHALREGRLREHVHGDLAVVRVEHRRLHARLLRVPMVLQRRQQSDLRVA